MAATKDDKPAKGRTALFPGSFNPFTIGHADIVERALRLFDNVVVAIGYNISKGDNGIAARQEAIARLYAGEPRVIVETYSDLTVDMARRHDATAIVKGVRSVKDFEYEREQAELNSLIGDGIETILLPARPELAAISSTAVRELQHFGHDVTPFLPR